MKIRGELLITTADTETGRKQAWTDGTNRTVDLPNVFMLSTEVRGQQRVPGSAESREGVTWRGKKNDCSQGGGEKGGRLAHGACLAT